MDKANIAVNARGDTWQYAVTHEMLSAEGLNIGPWAELSLNDEAENEIG